MKRIIKKISEYKSWQELKLKLIDTLGKKEKGDVFELITKYFLLIDPVYQTKLKNVWLLNEVPSDVKIYLHLPDNDEGIDLVAQTKENEYWAIQCKYRTDEESSIKRADITTFIDIANTICKNISHKLVCTTSSKQSDKFDKLYDDTISFLLADTWSTLNEEFFEKLNAYLDNQKIIFKPWVPLPHQQRAIENAYKHYIEENNNRGKLIMACGSGKSLTAYWIAQKLSARNMLIAVPSLALIKQTLEVWTRESTANNIDINWLAVCSDDTVSQDDTFMATTKDLGIKVSTNIEYISKWLSNTTHYNTTIIFTTYQSSEVIAKASKRVDFVFDFGIMDEAHKTAGLKGSLFSHLLFDENIFIRKRLFMTATERYYKSSSDEIASMDDIDIYGEDFEVLSFKEALESDPPILCDYKIISMMVTKREIEKLIEKNTYVKPKNENYTKEVEAEMLASTVALHKAIKKYNIKHTISFHSSIERAKFFQLQETAFRKSFSEYTHLDTFHVSGDTPTAKRKKVINEFANSENSLITNARCLTEGVDVPNIDCILFADPKNSTVDIVQAVGRALRLSKDKEFGYVVVPVLIDDEYISIEDIKNKNFQSILTILRALASSDDRIIDYFETIENKDRSNKSRLVNFDIPLGLGIDINEFNEAIKLSIIPKIKNLKWRFFEEAREFVRNLGLKNNEEWKRYCQNKLIKKDLKPSDIPSSPNSVYKLHGWNGMKDWLGTTYDLKYLLFEEAREFARSLGFKSKKEWDQYKHSEMEISNIPSNPHIVYYNSGWKGWQDWLGYSRLDRYLSYEEASQYVQSIGVNSRDKWRRFSKEKRPSNIPALPNEIYKHNGWIDWQHFFGTDKYSYKEAKKFVHTLNLTTSKEWIDYCQGQYTDLPKRPIKIPLTPTVAYVKEWGGWEDWLGNAKYLPFEEAREFVRKLGLKGQVEWKDYFAGRLSHLPSKPNNIPTDPGRVYSDKWQGFGDWVGTGRKRRANNTNGNDVWLPYEEAKKFVHTLQLISSTQWQQYIKEKLNDLPSKPDKIPKQPWFVYKDSGWKNWNDWLGESSNNKIRTKVQNALPFEEARAFVRSLKLKNTYEWKAYKKGELEGYKSIPDNIPKTPYSYYKDYGWIGMNDWLGISSINRTRIQTSKKVLAYEDAKKIVHTFGLKNTYEWQDYCKGKLKHLPPKPNNIPATPWNVYKNKGYISLSDWLGS
ncbi:DEAD/DEAH box helicase family protein [Sulfurimonas sp. HSL3-2]|uniref:restriction endonuclease n=1 Tax=Hydrocurvibacter mobilis TaxID=3131936 RepID=UPI0031F88670